MRAVITAGGLVDEAFARAIGTPVKALAPFRDGTLLDVALNACAGAGVDGIAVVGGDDVAAHLRGTGVRTIPAAADGGTNVERALDAWPGERFVYLTSDLPFVAAPDVRDLIARSERVELAMALASAAAYEARFPNAPPHGLALGRERIANGSAFVVGAAAAAPARALAARFFAARKNLLKLAALLGPMMCARFATRTLRIADLEAYASRALGVAVAAVRDCAPGLCYDVDTLAEYEDACARA
ncbi:MAG TPA: NTP transferase domain-containing protein [Candidatus Baltobacteraceae bacterium]|nr:NTP transferase domain-containing protein [Candidatus Baltobacteraceae bacterium]